MEQQPHLIQPAEYMFVVAPRTELAKFIEEARKLLLLYPEIIELIQTDLNTHAANKKRLRLADKQWEHQNVGGLHEGGMEQDPITDQDLTLGKGRPRMSPELCYFFMVIRGFAGRVKGLDALTLFMESTSVQLVLAEAGIKMPGLSTIIENTNAIRQETRDFILDAQLKMFLHAGRQRRLPATPSW